MRSMNPPTDLPAYVHYRPGVFSRAITAENPDGAPNAGGTAASPLGPGRKGRAFLPLAAGGTLTLADIDGPGVIRHIWITVPDQTPAGPYVLRDLVLTVHWDHDPQPAIQVPLGDFFGNGFATRAELTSAAMVVAPSGGMNCYLPMPFRRHATISITSDHPGEIPCAGAFSAKASLGEAGERVAKSSENMARAGDGENVEPHGLIPLIPFHQEPLFAPFHMVAQGSIRQSETVHCSDRFVDDIDDAARVEPPDSGQSNHQRQDLALFDRRFSWPGLQPAELRLPPVLQGRLGRPKGLHAAPQCDARAVDVESSRRIVPRLRDADGRIAEGIPPPVVQKSANRLRRRFAMR